MNRPAIASELLHVARSLMSRVLSPPPVMVKEITDWAQACVAVNRAFGDKFDIETYPGVISLYQERGDAAGVANYQKKLNDAKESLKRNIALAKGYGLPLKRWDRLSKDFKANLSGWKYEDLVRDAPNKDKADKKFGVIHAKIAENMRENAGGIWYKSNSTLKLNAVEDVERIIQHELIHWSQDYVNTALGISDFGLPPRSIRNPDVQQSKLEGTHSLDDVEFYPEILNLVDKAKKKSEETGESIVDVTKSMLGIGNPIDGATPPKFIVDLRKKSPEKWKAVVREVMEQRVASRIVQSALLNDYDMADALAHKVWTELGLKDVVTAFDKHDWNAAWAIGKTRPHIEGALVDLAKNIPDDKREMYKELRYDASIVSDANSNHWSLNRYGPASKVITLWFNAQLPLNIMDNGTIKPEYLARLHYDVRRYDVSIRHEVTHALRDAETHHLERFTKKSDKDKAFYEFYMSHHDEYEFERDAIINGLDFLHRRMKDEWDELGLADLRKLLPSFKLSAAMPIAERKKWIDRLVREDLMGKRMLKEFKQGREE